MSESGCAEAGGRLLLSVVVCTRNRSRALDRALASVAAQRVEGVELLVVDNGSTDATPEVVSRQARDHGWMRGVVEEKAGLSAARNRALREARGAYVLFLDDDAVPESGWLAAYLEFAASPATVRAGVMGGPVRPEYEAKVPVWYDRRRDRLDHGGEARCIPASGSLWGCNVAYRREWALALGGFDDRLGRRGARLGAHEESVMNERLAAEGYEVWWLPGAAIRHVLGGERLRFGWQMRNLYDQGRSSALLRMDGYRRPALSALARLILAPAQCVLLVVLSVLCLLGLQLRGAARALFRAARVAGFTVEMVKRLFR